MKSSTRKFEIRFTRERNKLERKGLRMFRTMFRDVYKSMIDELLDALQLKLKNLTISMFRTY